MQYSKSQRIKLIDAIRVTLAASKLWNGVTSPESGKYVSFYVFNCERSEKDSDPLNVTFSELDFENDSYVTRCYSFDTLGNYRQICSKNNFDPGKYSMHDKLGDENFCKQYGELKGSYEDSNLKDFYKSFTYCTNDNFDSEFTNAQAFYNCIQEIEVSRDLEDFIYKVDNFDTFRVNGIDEFICGNDDMLFIVDSSSGEKLITIERDKYSYIFEVNLTTKDRDNYHVRNKIKSISHLNKLISATISALREYDDFTRYADNLEDLINE